MNPILYLAGLGVNYTSSLPLSFLFKLKVMIKMNQLSNLEGERWEGSNFADVNGVLECSYYVGIVSFFCFVFLQSEYTNIISRIPWCKYMSTGFLKKQTPKIFVCLNIKENVTLILLLWCISMNMVMVLNILLLHFNFLYGKAYSFFIATLTNYHTLSSLNNTQVSSHSSEGQKSNMGHQASVFLLEALGEEVSLPFPALGIARIPWLWPNISSVSALVITSLPLILTIVSLP